MEIKEVEKQCRLEHYGSVKVKDARNNKRGGHHRGSGQRRKSKNQDSDKHEDTIYVKIFDIDPQKFLKS
ncbi:unnamed protein product [Onchocerca flexuosa]|uniref:Zinc finger, CCHC-type n=1 Tax=Onchocerca flexuosa TaxID=387005 RepID=A0A183HI80_9BILA|nr:unnamed protein product [Onchocerca flexuosa]